MNHIKPEFFMLIETCIDDYALTHGGGTPSVREIAAAIGMSKSFVSKYLNYMADNGMIQMNGVRNIVTKKKSGISEATTVPLLGDVACGLPKFANENIEEYVNLPTSVFGKGVFYLLRAKGDSMINAGVEDGDLVLVRQQNTADYNQIVVALMDDEATLKRFRPQEGFVILHPENPKYEDIAVENCIIQGVAVKVIKALE